MEAGFCWVGRQGSPGIVSNSKESYIEAGPPVDGGCTIVPPLLLTRGAGGGGTAGTAGGRGGSTVPPTTLSVPLLLTLLLVEPSADIGGKTAAAPVVEAV